MESRKIKKVSSWLLYHSGAQPTEPPKGGWLLVEDRDKPDAKHVELSSRPSWWGYRYWMGGAVGLFLLLTVWWAAGAHLAAAEVGGKRLSLGVSDSQLTKELQSQFASYKVPVLYADGTKQQFPTTEVGFSLDQKQTLNALRDAQHGTLQRFIWWRPITEQLSVKTHPKTLHSFIATNITKTVQPSQDATLTINKDGDVTVTDAVAGKHYGLDNPQMSLMNQVSDLRPAAIRIRTLTTNPAITSAELAASKTQLESVLTQAVSFDIGGKTIKPSKTDIAAWLELTPNPSTKAVDVDINSGKVQQYITKIAKANIHPARDQVEVTRDDGSVSVVVAGVNGVDITNKDAVSTEVTNNLLAGKGLSTSLPVSTTPFKTVSTSAYPKWIEVDLTNKRMHAYEKDSLVKTFLVSAGAPKTPTVTGKFAIYSKYAQKDMRGNNVDGSKYFQPNVPWVNFFYKDYAIHGNYWRPTSYFGNINSSHGCVSTVPGESAWIYD